MTRSVAVMQPYLWPYLGYFQLAAEVDELVLLDDVQFVKRRWMNRNRVLVAGSPRWLTLPVAAGPRERTIAEVPVAADADTGALRRTIEHAYAGSPGLDAALDVADAALDAASPMLVDRLEASLRVALDHLDVAVPMVRASTVQHPPAATPADRLALLVRARGGDRYVNPPGGRDLYTPDTFADHGVQLCFLETAGLGGPGDDDPWPGLSVLDALARFGVAEGRRSVRRATVREATPAVQAR